jgi:hypothetical protein
MRATGVIVRFLSLLDVFLVLFGVMLIALLHARGKSAAQGAKGADNSLRAAVDLDFIYVFAGWKGDQNGRCYVVGANRKVGTEEVRTDTAADIQRIMANQAAKNGGTNQLVLLLFSDDGWDSAWDAKKIQALEKTWNVKVVPVYNVRLAQ